MKEVGTVPGAEYSVLDFEEAFNKMARSAGVSDIAEVVERFRTQNQTSSSLTNQQSNAETDVREMGVLKEDLERRYSEVKFLGQDDIGDAREKIDEIELLIEDNMSRKGAALEHIKYITKRQETSILTPIIIIIIILIIIIIIIIIRILESGLVWSGLDQTRPD